MYYQYCVACSCYEYDCHGLEGCIRLQPGYLGPHDRHRMRQRHLSIKACEYGYTEAEHMTNGQYTGCPK